MSARRRDHEPAGVPATASVLTAATAFVLGLVVPGEGVVQRLSIATVFGVVGVLTGWRTVHVSGRRSPARGWGRAGLVVGVLALLVLGYQTLFIATDGAVPPPFWAPYARP
jgi:uncharacterized membrane protein HdeD (DUF308 family)